MACASISRGRTRCCPASRARTVDRRHDGGQWRVFGVEAGGARDPGGAADGRARPARRADARCAASCRSRCCPLLRSWSWWIVGRALAPLRASPRRWRPRHPTSLAAAAAQACPTRCARGEVAQRPAGTAARRARAGAPSSPMPRMNCARRSPRSRLQVQAGERPPTSDARPPRAPAAGVERATRLVEQLLADGAPGTRSDARHRVPVRSTTSRAHGGEFGRWPRRPAVDLGLDRHDAVQVRRRRQPRHLARATWSTTPIRYTPAGGRVESAVALRRPATPLRARSP